MKNRFHRILAVLSLAVAVSLTTALAQAETYKGSFDLPYDVSWSGIMLPAGHYQIWLEAEVSGAPFIHLNGPRGGMTLSYCARDLSYPSDRARLDLVDVGGTWVVQQFETGDFAQSFYFRLPKAKHAEIASKGTAVQTAAVIGIVSGR